MVRIAIWKQTKCLLVAGCLVASPSCKLGPNFRLPGMGMNPAWREAGQVTLVGQPQDRIEWWRSLNDPVLDSLIEEAFDQNLTLQAASLRIVQARSRRVFPYASMIPLVTAGGSATHVEFSETLRPDIDHRSSGRGAALLEMFGVKDIDELIQIDKINELDIYHASFDALWELDLWGEKRRAIERSNAHLDAAYADYDDVMVSLAGEVAANYVQIRILDQRIAALRQNVQGMKDFLSIAEERFDRGDAAEADMHLARTQSALFESTIPQLKNARRESENALSMLLGRMPQDLNARIGQADSFPTLPAQLSVGIPADLLRRRPDVRLAEHLAHAQCAKVGIAKARILPSFSLFGLIGLQSTDSDRFLDTDSDTSAYGAMFSATNLLLYPITVERVRQEDAQFEESILNYQSTVLNAMREVEDAMSAHLNASEEHGILADAGQSAERSSELAVGSYKRGRASVSVPIEALRMQIELQDRAIAAQGAAVTGAIAMYKALGGGWEVREGKELVPETSRKRMKDRTDWWSFFGPKDLKTATKSSREIIH